MRTQSSASIRYLVFVEHLLVNASEAAKMFVPAGVFPKCGTAASETPRSTLRIQRQGRKFARCQRTARALFVYANDFGYNVYLDPEDRAKRELSDNDIYAVVQKPLGLTLAERDDGMVYIAAVQPGGNAAKTGVLRPGQIVTAVSATFGDEIWSVRGVGLDRVLKSIKVRSGDFVTLVVEDEQTVEQKKTDAYEIAQRRAVEAREKYGEREVLDPVTWTSRSVPKNSSSDFNDPELERTLTDAVDEPFRQTWLLWALGGAVAIVAVLAFTFFT
jgi:hypothetical protein